MSLSFKSAPPPSADADLEPVPFSISVFRRGKDGEHTEEDHSYQCLPKAEVSGIHVVNVTKAAANGDVAAATAMWGFLEQVMDPDDLEDLDALLKDPEVYVDPSLLFTVSSGLYSEYAGRPTRQQRRSARGRSTAGRTSTARRSSAESD